MDANELNRKISELREPWISAWINQGGPVYDKSVGGAWWRGNGYDREPTDWTGSEEASAILLDELPRTMARRAIMFGGAKRREEVAKEWLEYNLSNSI